MSSDYHVIAKGLAELLCQKQAAYGDSFTRSRHIIEVLYPEGIPTDKYQDALTVVRIIDKLFRVANAKDIFQEDPWLDIAGYALLSLGRIENQKRASKLTTADEAPSTDEGEPEADPSTISVGSAIYDWTGTSTAELDTEEEDPDEMEKTALSIVLEKKPKPARKSMMVDNSIMSPKSIFNTSVIADMSRVAGLPPEFKKG